MSYLRLAILDTFLRIVSHVAVWHFSGMSLATRSFTFEVGSEIMFP
jgi:hypothetical protein